MESYLEKHAFCERYIVDAPHPDLRFVVVIPCLAERDILETLTSLVSCDPPRSHVEILIVVNQSTDSGAAIRHLNTLTLAELKSHGPRLEKNWIKLHSLFTDDLPTRQAGVGLARKIGMDEAIRRFIQVRQNDGIVINIDADCRCDRDYFRAIEAYFGTHTKIWAAGIYFEHDVCAPLLSIDVRHAIIRYELHLRYFVQAQQYAGFPFAYHTVGSSMAVRSSAYAQMGGMNKRKAGEDFHFLQKFISIHRFGQIGDTVVVPSSRASDRVPFGTGRAISKALDGQPIRTYSFSSFLDLQLFIDSIKDLYEEKEPVLWYQRLPQSIQSFLDKIEWHPSVKAVLENTASKATFVNRFFQWFNALRVIQFVHHAREIYPDVPVAIAASELSGALRNNSPLSEEDAVLLSFYRKYERELYA
ncbi:MAG: hypothetical protein OEQ53_04260 [Saprospiraceae bacterium]|nr:hypothetical protein [Saprospiraceae bacterium]